MPYATANGTRLFYTDSGTGIPVLFLHGWGTSGRVWGAQVADLAADHRVVTVDWRGCGRSDHPATGNTTATNAADILALMDRLALDRPLLVGSSLGATFALEAALGAPERVGGVVSISGPGYWPSQGMAAPLRALRAALAADRPAALADWVPQWFAPTADPALAEQTRRQILRSGVFIDELFAESNLHDPRADIGRLTVPALFIHGRLDTEVPLDVSRTLAALAPYGEFHAIEQAGHMPHQEQPAAVNALIRTALARQAAGTIPTATRSS
ncbi:alpha/beta fold hydrolase [Streptomyces bugieae]|uniref:Alpha/beta hydrolase n=1 Tax=Streptomyces bugieae TaxID=3098223 RepID=A0ABU7NJP7_9ACTN|nr:alpha/beta hydrolase [Streptomyces sp. DSM 41528]